MNSPPSPMATSVVTTLNAPLFWSASMAESRGAKAQYTCAHCQGVFPAVAKAYQGPIPTDAAVAVHRAIFAAMRLGATPSLP